jgi:pimeloyl-ACP methyl ester carboxylesterase
MPEAHVNGVRIHYELSGSGDIPIALVHGAWVSHRSWEYIAPRLAESFQVLTYDRRGHSASERLPEPSTVHDDVADLAGLIEHLGLAPVWVGGVSSGAAIALRLAGECPDLLRGLVAHEPALFALLAQEPAGATVLDEFKKRGRAVVDRIVAGDPAGAAKQFMETVAEGPGSWDRLPTDYREVLVENAPTWVDDFNDRDAIEFDPEWVEDFSRPALLTRGELSPPAFGPVLDMISDAIPGAEMVTLPAVGHIPHRTHPEEYAEVVAAFVSERSD